MYIFVPLMIFVQFVSFVFFIRLVRVFTYLQIIDFCLKVWWFGKKYLSLSSIFR